jgi:hypothetical protein
MIIDTAILVIILIVVGVIFSLVFGSWILVTTLRTVFGLFTGGGPDRRHPAPALPERQCPRRGCLTPNPSEARFCRHCGTPLAPARRVPSSRAACW